MQVSVFAENAQYLQRETLCKWRRSRAENRPPRLHEEGVRSEKNAKIELLKKNLFFRAKLRCVDISILTQIRVVGALETRQNANFRVLGELTCISGRRHFLLTQILL